MNIDNEANIAANAVAEKFDANVFVYSGGIDYKGFGSLVQTMQPSTERPLRSNSILFLTTRGGLANAAYQIARLIQNMSGKFYLCLPAECKSAGTLIALGATEIFMTSVSEIGPLDVQLLQRDEIGRRRSGMVVRTALDGLAQETFKIFESVMLEITVNSGKNISFDVASRIAVEIATKVMTPVYAQINPEALGNDLRDLEIATAYGHRLIEYGKNATKETIRKLVEDYPAHDFIVDKAEASTLFKVVKNRPKKFIT